MAREVSVMSRGDTSTGLELQLPKPWGNRGCSGGGTAPVPSLHGFAPFHGCGRVSPAVLGLQRAGVIAVGLQ